MQRGAQGGGGSRPTTDTARQYHNTPGPLLIMPRRRRRPPCLLRFAQRVARQRVARPASRGGGLRGSHHICALTEQRALWRARLAPARPLDTCTHCYGVLRRAGAPPPIRAPTSTHPARLHAPRGARACWGPRVRCRARCMRLQGAGPHPASGGLNTGTSCNAPSRPARPSCRPRASPALFMHHFLGRCPSLEPAQAPKPGAAASGGPAARACRRPGLASIHGPRAPRPGLGPAHTRVHRAACEPSLGSRPTA